MIRRVQSVIRGGRLYRVRVFYREPTYEAQTGKPRAVPYHWTFRVPADCPGDARNLAFEEFREMERISSVGWTREIVGSIVLPVEPEVATA